VHVFWLGISPISSRAYVMDNVGIRVDLLMADLRELQLSRRSVLFNREPFQSMAPSGPDPSLHVGSTAWLLPGGKILGAKQQAADSSPHQDSAHRPTERTACRPELRPVVVR
jgi:hypothetical protein